MPPAAADASNPADPRALFQGKTPAERQKLLAQLWERHKEKLRVMVDIRLHPRLRGRIEASDVLQESFIEASKRLEKYLGGETDMPFHLWLRHVTACKLQDIHRVELAKIRDVRREVAMHQPRAGAPQATSVALAAHMAARQSRVSKGIVREERKAALARSLEQLDPEDREVLALRHFESLTSEDAARVLGISGDAARKRYARALDRLRKIVQAEGVAGDTVV